MMTSPRKERDRTQLIIVGTGDYYGNLLAPSLALLCAEESLNLRATISTSPKRWKDHVEHRIRHHNETLTSLLTDIDPAVTIVLLGHSNELHTPDAVKLVNAGYAVFIEKPYAINHAQLTILENLIKKFPHRIVLMEYYVMMKTIPLLLLGGLIKRNSFYFHRPNVLTIKPGLSQFATSLPKISGRLQSLIGSPTFVQIDILEGEGTVGTLHHRGAGLSDSSKGGGMIQDLGLHAVAPLMTLEPYIGRIDDSFQHGSVQTARCREFVSFMSKRLHLPSHRIAESFAEIECITATGVPIHISVGKYVLRNSNQRRILIVGREGRLLLDLTTCRIFLGRGTDAEVEIMESPKHRETKYYPVLAASRTILRGHSPFTFDSTDGMLRAQRFILNVVQRARRLPSHSYQSGVPPTSIRRSL